MIVLCINLDEHVILPCRKMTFHYLRNKLQSFRYSVKLFRILQVDLQLTRTPRPLPTMKINPDVKDIFSFHYEDFQLENYDPWPHIAGKVSV